MMTGWRTVSALTDLKKISRTRSGLGIQQFTTLEAVWRFAYGGTIVTKMKCTKEVYKSNNNGIKARYKHLLGLATEAP
jgi:hypothetical protein